MATGQFLRMGFTATDNTLQKFYPNDGILTVGSKFLLDAGKKACYPAQAANLPGGTVLKNLVDGGPDAIVQDGLTFDNGAFVFAGGRLLLGTSYGLVAAGNPDALWIIWVKLGDSTAGFQGLLQRAELTTPTKAEFNIDLGNDGALARGTVWESSGAGVGAQKAINRNQVVQIALVIQGGKLAQWINAVKNDEKAFAKPYATPEQNYPVVIGGGYGGFSPFTGKVYRAYHENLTTSGRSAADVITMDYAGNSARFV
jgi:hypothetical protein